MTAGRAPASTANQASSDARHSYRSNKSYSFKATPQGDLAITVHFPFDWVPEDQRPAILFFFGGGFRIGTREQFTRQAVYLASRGMVAATADYRIKDKHDATIDQCVEDAKSAMRWFREHSPMLGIDVNRIVASGGSAGGYLALSTAIIPGLETVGEDVAVSYRPNALVLFNPALSRRVVDDRVPTEELGRQLTPIHHVTPETPPMLVMFGTQDRLLPGALEFMEKTEALGCRVEKLIVEGAGHGFFNRDPWFKPTLHRADEFLASLGYVEGAPTFKVS